MKIVAELPRGDEEGAEKLLLHAVMLARVTEHRADEVDGVLYELQPG